MRFILMIVAASCLSGCSAFLDRVQSVGNIACENKEAIKLALSFAYQRAADTITDPEARESVLNSIEISIATLDLCQGDES